MKLAVSTLGCPEWTLPEILTRLPSYGYEGVELRGLGADLDLTRFPAFATPEAAVQTRQAFAEAGLDVCCVDTSASFADPARATAGLGEARNGINLAGVLGAPFVRVFGGSVPDGGSRADAVGSLARHLQMLGEYAEACGGVTVVLETHDDFSTGAQVAEVMAQVNHARVGALWDLHHPYRQGESPEETWRHIGPWVRHTHVKDSRPPHGYCLLGEGDVPVREMLRLLRASGYDGWLSLEWEKRWHPDIADPSVAFPQYAATLREYLAEL